MSYRKTTFITLVLSLNSKQLNLSVKRLISYISETIVLNAASYFIYLFIPKTTLYFYYIKLPPVQK